MARTTTSSNLDPRIILPNSWFRKGPLFITQLVSLALLIGFQLPHVHSLAFPLRVARTGRLICWLGGTPFYRWRCSTTLTKRALAAVFRIPLFSLLHIREIIPKTGIECKKVDLSPFESLPGSCKAVSSSIAAFVSDKQTRIFLAVHT